MLVYASVEEAFAQSRDQQMKARVDSTLSARYYRHGDIDTTYITRPTTKWTFVGRMNMSGAKIEAEGLENGRRFCSEMTADRKATVSVAVSYLGYSLSAALNPAKLLGKYRDYELNFNSYGKRFGFDIIYQDAHNFTGWHEGVISGDNYSAPSASPQTGRIELPPDMLSVRTLNLNAFYVVNSRHFSYPAAFSQSYIQHRSAGRLLLAASAMGQHATLKWEQEMQLKMTNIALGAGYSYNYVPYPTHPAHGATARGHWLLHISALPTFICYSNTSMTFGDNRVPLHYHFPEVIITGRGAVVRQWGNKFLGMSMVFNFTNIGHEQSLALHNIKWRLRTFFGLRL